MPEDLSNAVYDLPGYAGHTAFVEGFKLNAAIKAGSSIAEVTAIADTGTSTTTATIQITKECVGSEEDLEGALFRILLIPDETEDGFYSAENVECGETANIVVTPANGPALYRFGETTQGDETLLGWSLVIGGEEGDDCSSVPPASITISAGETLQCTFTNTYFDYGTIIIRKVANPIPQVPDTFFTFTDNIPDFCQIGALISGAERTCLNVPVGTYTVTENNPSGLGYRLSTIVCESTFPSPAGGTGNVETRTATINLSLEETVTCIFTNVPASSSTPTTRPSSTPTPTMTPTPTATPTATSVVDDPERRGGLGALFAPRPATPTPQLPAAASAPSGSAPAAGIRPPSTGDGGLEVNRRSAKI